MILNLTQHQPQPNQASAGLQPPPDWAANLLTFTGVPTPEVIRERAERLAAYAAMAASAGPLPDTGSPGIEGPDGGFWPQEDAPVRVLIGGLPALMGPLERALRSYGLVPVYSHSERVSVEETQPDGSVLKVNVFRHVDFYEGAL